MSEQFSPLAVAEKHFGAEAIKRPPSRRELYSAIDALSGALMGVRARVEALESHGIKFVGNYQRAQAYRRGFVTTHKGAMWTALRDVGEGIEPGTSPADWQLTVKGDKT